MHKEGSIGNTGLTCLVADRHPDMRESLALLLEHEGFTVVGKATTGSEAIRFVETHRPDLIVLDLRLGTVTGIDVAREAVRRLGLTAAIVLHASEATPELVREAFDAGVRGIAREAVPPLPLLKAIAAAVAGDVYIDPAFGDPRSDRNTGPGRGILAGSRGSPVSIPDSPPLAQGSRASSSR